MKILNKIKKHKKYNSCSHAIMWHPVLQKREHNDKNKPIFFTNVITIVINNIVTIKIYIEILTLKMYRIIACLD